MRSPYLLPLSKKTKNGLYVKKRGEYQQGEKTMGYHPLLRSKNKVFLLFTSFHLFLGVTALRGLPALTMVYPSIYTEIERMLFCFYATHLSLMLNN